MKVIEDATTGLSEQQQETVVNSFGRVLEKRLTENTGNKLTVELQAGIYHLLMQDVDTMTKSVIAGSKPNIPGANLEGKNPALTDDEVNDLLIKPNTTGDTDQ